MCILLLYNNEISLDLCTELKKNGENVVLFSEKIDLNKIKKLNTTFIISYNYRYFIGEDVIKYMNNKIVNLHTSFLPWNRGANPNLWSFIDNTPKGVTIHQLSEKLDRGKILLQKEVTFDEKKETFASSYKKLNNEIVELFINNWKAIKNGELLPKKQIENGTYHTTKDYLSLKEKIDFTWNDNISEFMQRYNKMIREGE